MGGDCEEVWSRREAAPSPTGISRRLRNPARRKTVPRWKKIRGRTRERVRSSRRNLARLSTLQVCRLIMIPVYSSQLTETLVFSLSNYLGLVLTVSNHY